MITKRKVQVESPTYCGSLISPPVLTGTLICVRHTHTQKGGEGGGNFQLALWSLGSLFKEARLASDEFFFFFEGQKPQIPLGPVGAARVFVLQDK